MLNLRLALPLAALALPLVTPSQARACGGTFCDNTAVPMPVDQRGEDILFVQDGPEFEVHIRIEYEGEAERFAWLVPLQAVPQVSVGSEPLFLQLSEATAPSWTRSHGYECPDEDIDDDPTTTGLGFVPESDVSGAPEPEIVLQEIVGAFEVVVLQGGTAAEVIEFLNQNDYAQDPEAEPILQEYLDEGFLFAAVKLTSGASADSIHPLVFRFPGDEPCVPIRLTRIAAEQDMGIRTYFLGQQRWAPQNYRHVVLNPLALPWSENSGNYLPLYEELLTLAVDEAGGRAFATDYAGAASKVETSSVYNPSWDETAFVGLNMIEALAEISNQSLAGHPLIQSLLLEFMPPPEGVNPLDFWNFPEAYIDLINIEAWDSAGFAAALAERIIDPGMHAVDLLETWPYLTRLNTTMSPHEMTVDPMFQPTSDLGDVSNVLMTTSTDMCGQNAGIRYLVPLQSQLVPLQGEALPVCIADFEFQWPAQLQAHPALRIEQIPAMGPPQVIEDFTEQVLAAHAQLDNFCIADGGGDEGETDGSSDEGGPGDGGDESGDASLSNGDGKVGCACRSDASGSSTGAPLGLLGLLGLASLVGVRRRRPLLR
jgi:MYXO-CTERM domain-containing protein